MKKKVAGGGAVLPAWEARYVLLRGIGDLVLGDAPDETLLRDVTDLVIRASGADGGFLIRVTGAAEGKPPADFEVDFEVVLARNYKRGDIGKPEFEISRTLIRQVIAGGKPVFLENAMLMPTPSVSRSISQLKVISVIAFPLRLAAEGMPHAVIYLDRRRPGHHFSPDDLDCIRETLEWAGQAIALALETRQLRKNAGAGVARNPSSIGLIGDSPALNQVCDFIERAAKSAANVLLRGETGTGKDLVAQCLHQRTAPAGSPFVAVNCSAIPAELLESELFGHEAGAFTGAQKRRVGRFQEAAAGTLFLDEIGDLPLPLQAKLLRVVETRRFNILGGPELPFRARLISATHQPLEKMVQGGGFRQDLYYRLNVLELTLPPLRRRRGDINALARHFIAASARRHGRLPPQLAPAALQFLQQRAWPGNIRELAHLIERAMLFSDGPRLERRDLATHAQEAQETLGESLPRSAAELQKARDLLTSDLERRFIEDLLKRHHGDVAAAARSAGFSRPYLYRMIKSLLPDSLA